jgi:hypothetical protein
VPSEEPAAGTTVVVADKPAEEPEAGAVSDGSDAPAEATVVDAPASSSEESAGVDDILSKVMPRRLLVRCYDFQSKCLLVYRLARLWGLARIVRSN